MDEFFQLYNFDWDMEWPKEAVLVNTSAFVRYIKQPIGELAPRSHGNGLNHQNVNKRMIEFLKKTSTRMRVETTIETESTRSHKHAISERMRREKHKQSYLALHKLLPLGTKSDKNSILHMAAKNIEELQKNKEELERRNGELEMVLAGKVNEIKEEKALIKLKVANPASGIDSMLEVLRCLENTGSKVSSRCSHLRFWHHLAAAVSDSAPQSSSRVVEIALEFRHPKQDKKFHMEGVCRNSADIVQSMAETFQLRWKQTFHTPVRCERYDAIWREIKFADMAMSFKEDKIRKLLLWARKNLSREMDLFGGDMETLE
ncbi:unnamed protein product [Fraxinus pennsylvanica]|uniref:BHLH domain-containing protein n=1 Tax=Fraxinus pennsylvanica TaxID=56036 RepID=A0AAD1ZQ81_9LAMI|nr:unnamed protein product [Fraxinus pennsylvanica]